MKNPGLMIALILSSFSAQGSTLWATCSGQSTPSFKLYKPDQIHVTTANLVFQNGDETTVNGSAEGNRFSAWSFGGKVRVDVSLFPGLGMLYRNGKFDPIVCDYVPEKQY